MMPNMQNFIPTWLNASYYQNIPHNEVNWGQLAQQWMAMRAVESRFAAPLQPVPQFPPLISFPPHPTNAPPPPLPPDEPPPPLPPTMGIPPQPRAHLFPAFEAANSTPRFQRRFPTGQDFPHQFPNSSNIGQHSTGLLPTPVFRPPQQQQHVEYANFNFHRAPGSTVIEQQQHQQKIPSLMSEDSFTLDGPFAHQFHASYESDDIFPTQDTDYRKWKPPLLNSTDETSYYSGYSNDCSGEPVYGTDETMFDMQQRKHLPAWIREGLEKVERERQKQKEKDDRDQFLKDKQENKWKSLAKKGKSRFDDSDDSDEENNGSTEETNDADRKNTDKELDQHHKTFSDVDEDSAATPPLSIEEQRAELTAKLRRWLTEILMEVTNSEIEKIAQQTHKAKLKRAQPKVLAQSSALATIKSLGADYDDDSGTDEESSNDEEEIASGGNTAAVSDVIGETSSSANIEPFKRPLLPPQTVFSKKKVSSNVGTTVETSSTNEKESADVKTCEKNDEKDKTSSNGSCSEKKSSSSSSSLSKKRSKDDRSDHRRRSRSPDRKKSSKKSSRSRSRSRESSDRRKSSTYHSDKGKRDEDDYHHHSHHRRGDKQHSSSKSSKKDKRSSRSRSRSRSKERSRKRSR